MPPSIILKQTSQANSPTPGAGQDRIFFDSLDGNPKYEDANGVIYNLTGPTGLTGPPGFSGVFGIGEDGEEIDIFYSVPGPAGNPGATGASGISGGTGPSGGAPLIYPEDGDDGLIGPPAFLTTPPSNGFAGWTLLDTFTFSGQASRDYTNLGNVNDMLLMLIGITFSASADLRVRFSVDNGGTFNTTNYQQVPGNGTTVVSQGIFGWNAGATTARSQFVEIQGLRLVTIKHCHLTFYSTDGTHFQYMDHTAADINAIRVGNSGIGNFSGGTLYVLVR